MKGEPAEVLIGPGAPGCTALNRRPHCPKRPRFSLELEGTGHPALGTAARGTMNLSDLAVPVMGMKS
jgi:hypothetical protein